MKKFKLCFEALQSTKIIIYKQRRAAFLMYSNNGVHSFSSTTLRQRSKHKVHELRIDIWSSFKSLSYSLIKILSMWCKNASLVLISRFNWYCPISVYCICTKVASIFRSNNCLQNFINSMYWILQLDGIVIDQYEAIDNTKLI